MNNLKEDLKNIYEFVNTEFDIDDKEQLKAIKEGLTLEKIEMLDEMLNDYKKAINKAKRKEQQKVAQSRFKKAGVNLKIEEYEIFEVDAENKNLNMSQYVKKALNGFIKPDTVKADKVGADLVLDSLKPKYEALQVEKSIILRQLTEEKEKSVKFEKNLKVEQKLKNDYQKENADILKEKSVLEQRIKNLESLSIWEFIKTKIGG